MIRRFLSFLAPRISILRDQAGSIMTETAFVSLFFFIAFSSMVEVCQLIETREKVNKIANQLAQVLGSEKNQAGAGGTITLPNGTVVGNPFSEYWSAWSTAYYYMGAPNHFSIGAYYCKGGSSAPIGGDTQGNGTCGYGAPVGNYTSTPICNAGGPGYSQYISVSVGCRYSPLFNVFGLLNTIIRTDVQVPLYYHFL